MYKGFKILATIGARGGSKGVKNKNIRKLGGLPLICYSLNAVKSSELIDNYIISTDSDEIIKVVKEFGFDVHFKRPDYLAGDKISRLEATKHAVSWVEENLKKNYEIIIDIGAATPLKNSEDLDNAIKLLIDNKVPNVFSVTPSERNPYYNMVEIINGEVELVKKMDIEISDRRDAPQTFDMNDGINVFWKEVLFSDNQQFNKGTKIYVMPKERSIDIDEEYDFLIAEFLVKNKKI